MSFSVGCYQKVWPRLRVDLLISNEPVKKIPHMCAQPLMFSLIPDVVRLITKISHHSGRKIKHHEFCYLESRFNVYS